MSRLRRIEQSRRYFFITTNLAKPTAPFSASERDQILNDLQTVRSARDFLLLAYVVMPDHLDLLLYPREATLSAVLQDLKRRTTRSLHNVRHATGPIWQSRFFDFICRRVRDFYSKVEYIHQNPVTAGLVDTPEDWPWSSAFPGAQQDRAQLPLGADALLWPAPSH